LRIELLQNYPVIALNQNPLVDYAAERTTSWTHTRSCSSKT